MKKVINNKILILCIMVILWMFLIFSLSSQVREQSNGLSTGISVVIEKVVDKVLPSGIDFDIKSINHIVRKSAHFFIYFILGVLVMSVIRKNKLLAFLICIFYAISDELHQFFVPGRGPEIKDVFIDSIGAYIGIYIVSIILRKIMQSRKLTLDQKYMSMVLRK